MIMMKKKKQTNSKLTLLIDGENILHQSFHKFEKLKSTDGKPSGAIFGFFKSLHMYINRFNPDDIYISFDNGRSKYRTDILPEYKGHRKTRNIAVDYESLIKQKQQIMVFLKYLRIKYIYDKKKTTNYEGDDFLAYLVLKNKHTNNRYILISSDKDFNQLLRGNKVKIYNPRKETLVYEKNCKEVFGYLGSETVDYLSMVGDTSDDIKGFNGIGPVKARKILDDYGNISNWFKHCDKERLKYQDIWYRNRDMIDLEKFIEEHPLDDIPIKNYNSKDLKVNKIKEFCVDYSFSSFMTQDFIKPFVELVNKKV